MTGRRERYLSEVTRRIFAKPEDVERLRADLQSHFADASERGESEAEVITRLGRPEETADAFMLGVELEYAGFWPRFCAFLADLSFCALLATPALALCGAAASLADEAAATIALVAVAILGVGVALSLAVYFPLLEGRFGKTFGKHLLGLRVRTEEGAEIGYGAAFLRRLSLYFEILVLDAIFVPFTEKKQRAFDMVAKTVVLCEPGTKPGAGRYLLCLLVAVAPLLIFAVGAALFAVINNA
jgi:uncharacterized RDD family membrane protein YckC